MVGVLTMPIFLPPSTGGGGAKGIIGIGIAWTAAGTALPGDETYTDLGATAIDTVFADVGGVASSPHGLTDGKLMAPVAGNYVARANVGGFDSGHPSAVPVEAQFSFAVNGSALGMGGLYVQVPSVAGDFHMGGDMSQPLTLAAGDLVNVNGGYWNTTAGASLSAMLYSFELEQV